jgi:hypothetical protein
MTKLPIGLVMPLEVQVQFREYPIPRTCTASVTSTHEKDIGQPLPTASEAKPALCPRQVGAKALQTYSMNLYSLQ